MFVCCISLSVNMTCILFKLPMQKEQQRGGFAVSRGLSWEGTTLPILPGVAVQSRALILCLVCKRRLTRDFRAAVSPQPDFFLPSEKRS